MRIDSKKLFASVKKAIDNINSNHTDHQAEYVEGLNRARNDIQEAIKAKEAAQTETELDDALEAENLAKSRAAFYKRRLDEDRYTMRMDEREYDSYLGSMITVMHDAADKYRAISAQAVQQLIAARAEYLEMAAQVDTIMRQLDAAANVLQVRHRYRTMEFVGRDPVQIADPNEWHRYTLRYTDGKAYNVAVRDINDAGESYVNNIYRAAWKAAEIAQKSNSNYLG